MARKSIKQIRAQFDRAIRSLNEGGAADNKYMNSQVRAYVRNNSGLGESHMVRAIDYAGNQYRKRGTQLVDAANKLMEQTRQKGRDARAARKAQGLSAG